MCCTLLQNCLEDLTKDRTPECQKVNTKDPTLWRTVSVLQQKRKLKKWETGLSTLTGWPQKVGAVWSTLLNQDVSKPEVPSSTVSVPPSHMSGISAPINSGCTSRVFCTNISKEWNRTQQHLMWDVREVKVGFYTGNETPALILNHLTYWVNAKHYDSSGG